MDLCALHQLGDHLYKFSEPAQPGILIICWQCLSLVQQIVNYDTMTVIKCLTMICLPMKVYVDISNEKWPSGLQNHPDSSYPKRSASINTVNNFTHTNLPLLQQLTPVLGNCPVQQKRG